MSVHMSGSQTSTSCSIRSLSCSSAQAMWESWPVFFQVYRGAFDGGRRPSGSRRRGEPGGIQNAAVQHSSPEINNSIWSSARCFYCVIIHFWATFLSPFKYRFVSVSRSLSLGFTRRPLSLRRVYRPLVSDFLSVFVLLHVICVAVPLVLLGVFFLFDVFHVFHLFWFF